MAWISRISGSRTRRLSRFWIRRDCTIFRLLTRGGRGCWAASRGRGIRWLGVERGKREAVRIGCSLLSWLLWMSGRCEAETIVPGETELIQVGILNLDGSFLALACSDWGLIWEIGCRVCVYLIGMMGGVSYLVNSTSSYCRDYLMLSESRVHMLGAFQKLGLRIGEFGVWSRDIAYFKTPDRFN